MGTEAKKLLRAIYNREARREPRRAGSCAQSPLLPADPSAVSFPDSKKAFLKNIQL